MKVSFFKNQFLNTTQRSVIKALEEEIILSTESVADAEFLNWENATEQINGKLLSVEINKSFICCNCKNRLYEDEKVKKVVIKCHSYNLSSLRRNFTIHITANMVIQPDQGKSERFHCPMTVLKRVTSKRAIPNCRKT